ncbi:GPI ethanolamine phosphate transferase 3 isoform X1 [Boleophthalmus pectinirostris]|uniref:GPI ethanolamine phosphate transferase 3 isoform X1 n=1 Tax=Boleophthalmus pectinirostris TaxID=150288 RepID=UPI00242D69AB|nr:GPI ethanolamine phosphate transferase 3 isoform X1 [Boleophthalmus pectinirostris]XP_055009375.1 GPI ethanolamine phosphate transferase 3 isoform X1 [Boleophthalmus pectinirostris]
MKWFPVLSLLFWICAVYITGIYLFVGGFLLVRMEVNRTSSCLDALYPGQGPERDFCRGQPRFHKAVLLIIDALKIDFARFDPNNTSPRPYENKLPVLEETVSAKPSHSRLYPFRADPPTTTMQRIKGFTTGSLPTFIDVGNNFASSAILEDNLIQQLGQVGKRVVFMGDDTWENLYPKRFHRSLPFPSFNVKDLHTVDDGILQNIYTTLEGDDWDVLVAHFLGVDHCGHRFGPDHPAMADKLTQMDGVIRSVMRRLQNDTLLVVMGDHGMTDTGDHGGESQKETDAAIFIYSPSPLFQQPQNQLEPEVVPQTDLVPTLALLLGIPIPYSSVGQVLLPLFPPHGQSAVGALSQQEALWINAKQVNRFLETYSSMAKDIPPETLSQLRAQFSSLSSEYITAHQKGLLSSPQLTASLQSYLTSVRDTCRATWAKFNPFKMAAGLIILALACVTCLLLSELSLTLIREDNALKSSCIVAVLTGICVAIAQLLSWGYMEVPWCVAGATLTSELLFIWKAYKTRTVAKTASKKSASWFSVTHLLTPAVFILLLRCASLLSDSYVIAEGRVVTFLVFSLALYIPVHLNWHGYLLPQIYDSPKPSALLPSPPLPSSVVRKEASTLMASLALVIGSLFLSLFFHGCREEQGSCQPSPFLSPLSRMQDDKLKNLHYVLSVSALALYTYFLRNWMRNYGNLNASCITVFTANWILPLSSISLGLHWAVSGTPEDSFKNLSELIGLAQLALPRAAYCLLTAGLFLIWLDPLTVFIKSKTSAQNRLASRLPPRYRASIGISPQAELHHLIPQIYQQMRQSLDDGELSGYGEEDGRPAVEAYGLGTVYSAPLLLSCGMLGLVLLLLHPEGMALAFLLLLLEMGAVLYIHASSNNLSGPGRTEAGGFNVPWTPVVLWALAATQFFHATGHLPTFPSIQWGAAFVGFPDGHTGTIIPASLVTLNTFASHILLAVSCPLLLLWPLVCEVRSSRGGRTCGEEVEDAVMEIRLRESPQQFSSALLQLSARYLFVHGAQVFASVCAAAILRRHLMVWKVFAPKLMFETSAFIVTSVSVLLGVTFVLRIDSAVTRWFKRLVPDASR